MNVFELAKHYYPRLWDARRIRVLEQAGRLTAAQTAELLGTERKG